jgi:hypothetical protein
MQPAVLTGLGEEMPLRRKFCASLLVLVLSIGVLSIGVLSAGSAVAQKAQQPASPAADARVVRVQIGHTSGMCGGNSYCSNLTTVTPSFIIAELSDAPDKKKWPDKKAKRAITKQEWGNLRRAIDTKALMDLPPEVCYATIDLPCSWVAVEFSDGTKINVLYDPTHPPAPVAAVLGKTPGVQITFGP